MNKGRTAVVTGAGGTLCGPIAVDLAKQGCKVVLVGRTLEKLQKTADAVHDAGADCLVITADVKDEARMKEVRVEVNERYGRCTILVNGAGGNQNDAVTNINEFDPSELVEGHGFRGFFDLDMNRFKDVIETNIMGTVIPTRVFALDMIEAGGGSIVNFASMNTYRPLSRVPAYACAKAAVSNWTQWIAAYLAPAGIRVNAIAPGFFVNDRSRKMLMTPDGGLSPRGQRIHYNTPMHRFGQAEELLGCLNWLIDDEKAGFVTGITVPVDGGFLCSPGL
ncbi:MAG: SDR family NAD(P)-dependent oxidoreductase [Bacteroidales bacterium]|nr:SDR family NAD(P)-dependent oxidoreductase [Bacteroidales bacterium]